MLALPRLEGLRLRRMRRRIPRLAMRGMSRHRPRQADDGEPASAASLSRTEPLRRMLPTPEWSTPPPTSIDDPAAHEPDGRHAAGGTRPRTPLSTRRDDARARGKGVPLFSRWGDFLTRFWTGNNFFLAKFFGCVTLFCVFRRDAWFVVGVG